MRDASQSAQLRSLLGSSEPILALAPMQDITDLPFLAVTYPYGGPDFYVTEYFRAHSASTLRKTILRCIIENPTPRPVVAQLAGRDVKALTRMARELQQHPIAAVDFNLGCPAPIVCKKRAGGGLLRELPLVDTILGALREAVTTVPFTVKTRLGFDRSEEFDSLLPVFAKHALDLVIVHGRTVRQLYGGLVHYDRIAQAVNALSCPVIANGDIDSPQKAFDVLALTGASGVMIGRAAIRNPWLFRQIRQRLNSQPITYPTGREVAKYLKSLYDATTPAGIRPRDQVDKFKKYLNFIGPGLPTAEQFLYDSRRMVTEADLDALIHKHLDHDEPLRLERQVTIQ